MLGIEGETLLMIAHESEEELSSSLSNTISHRQSSITSDSLIIERYLSKSEGTYIINQLIHYVATFRDD